MDYLCIISLWSSLWFLNMKSLKFWAILLKNLWIDSIVFSCFSKPLTMFCGAGEDLFISGPFPCVCLTSEKFSAFRSLEFALDRTRRVKNKRKHKITSHDTKQKSNMADFYWRKISHATRPFFFSCAWHAEQKKSWVDDYMRLAKICATPPSQKVSLQFFTLNWHHMGTSYMTLIHEC